MQQSEQKLGFIYYVLLQGQQAGWPRYHQSKVFWKRTCTFMTACSFISIPNFLNFQPTTTGWCEECKVFKRKSQNVLDDQSSSRLFRISFLFKENDKKKKKIEVYFETQELTLKEYHFQKEQNISITCNTDQSIQEFILAKFICEWWSLWSDSLFWMN